MDCSDFLDGYSDYDDSLLPPADEAAFRDHLEVCASCQRYDRVLRKGRMVARQVSGPAPSREAIPGMRQGLWTDSGHAGRWRSRTGVARVPGPMAAMTRLPVAGGVLTLALAAVLAVQVLDSPGAPRLPLEQLHVHQEGVLQRPAVLPPSAYADPHRDWTVARVDHPAASSYSPLVTGPPAYRAERVTFTSTSPSLRSTLD